MQIGKETTLGKELQDKELKQIEDRIHYVVDKIYASIEKTEC